MREGGRAGPRSPLAGFWQLPLTLDAANPQIPNLPLLTGGGAPPVDNLAWMLVPAEGDDEQDDEQDFIAFIVPIEVAAEVDLAWMLAPEWVDTEVDDEFDEPVLLIADADLAWLLPPYGQDDEYDDELPLIVFLVPGALVKPEIHFFNEMVSTG